MNNPQALLRGIIGILAVVALVLAGCAGLTAGNPTQTEPVQPLDQAHDLLVDDVTDKETPAQVTAPKTVPERQASLPTPTSRPPTPTPQPTATPTPAPISVPLTAVTGFDAFSAYRMAFDIAFDGTQQGQPSVGQMAGFVESTQNPAAKHLQLNLAGETLRALVPLPEIEVYDVGETFYIENPADGTWVGVPALFINTLMPGGVDVSPTEVIDLPSTATLHPGEESINGITTQRYTFDGHDLAENGSKYDYVAGTIWVAVDGDYVVKYEATFSGQHDNLSAGGITLLDKGTISIRYDLSDINSSLTIDPPAGAVTLGLGDLLFN